MTPDPVDVGALALNVAIPPALRWTATRRDEEFELQSITVRLLPDGTLAAKAYGRPVAGGRGGYVAFPVPDRPELTALVERSADAAATAWGAHPGRATPDLATPDQATPDQD